MNKLLPFFSLLCIAIVAMVFINLDSWIEPYFSEVWQRDVFIGLCILFSGAVVYLTGKRIAMNNFLTPLFGLLLGLHYLAIGIFLFYLVIRVFNLF